MSFRSELSKGRSNSSPGIQGPVSIEVKDQVKLTGSWGIALKQASKLVNQVKSGALARE